MSMGSQPSLLSTARLERRENIVMAAAQLIGTYSTDNFDPVHSSLCAIDVVMVAGAPWLKDGLERDYSKDESGYKKIGGGANSPQMAYFFRSTANLIHYLKRQGFYVPRGATPGAEVGMACFLDWDDRGRFNFAPDRSGIITEVAQEQITKIIVAQPQKLNNRTYYCVEEMLVSPNDALDRAIIGYSDLP